MTNANATHCIAGANCRIAYGTPESLGIPADFTDDTDDCTVSGPIAKVAAYMLLHGFDIAKFDNVATEGR